MNIRCVVTGRNPSQQVIPETGALPGWYCGESLCGHPQTHWREIESQ
jgi:hypothetical protein